MVVPPESSRKVNLVANADTTSCRPWSRRKRLITLTLLTHLDAELVRAQGYLVRIFNVPDVLPEPLSHALAKFDGI